MSDNVWGQQPELADDFSDLDSMGDEYRAQHAYPDKLESLADGPYDCEIDTAALDMIKGDRILRLVLKVGGRRVEHLYWLNRQETLNGLAADLCTLGFDADRWGPAFNRPLSVELPKAVQKLAGVKFRAVKSSRDGTGAYAGRRFHDLHVNALIAGRTMPTVNQPSTNGPAASAQPAVVQPAAQDDSIPF